MKLHRILTAALVVLALTLAVVACASAADVRPIPIDHDTLDLGNGEFRMEVRNTDRVYSGGYFIAVLHLEDHYDGEQIMSLAPGDTVLADDRVWTVDEVVVHTIDGLVESVEYEIYTVEGMDGYLVFSPCEDGTFISVMNDWNPITLAGSVKVTLPLPDDFEYICDGEEKDAKAFTDDLEEHGRDRVNPYNTSCEFRDGVLVRVVSDSYPYGPDDDGTEFSPVPVWKFCHGFRDGLDTAVITGYTSDCEEGLSQVEMTPEEIEEIRLLAMNGTVTGKANDEFVTGGTWVYSFETPAGKHLLSIEIYRGLIVSSDGMYRYK